MSDAELVLGCADLDEALARFRALGFRLDTIFPADAPSVMQLSRGAERIRLVRSDIVSPVFADELRPAFVVTRATGWHAGRAGMQYRDLVPDRLGGRFIASHIRVPDGGPVPDYVHHHSIRFQVIYCYRGWVGLVYEDQGDPLTLREGECVVQPPNIRHRVLESSPGLEVLELASPAVHPTHVEHDLELPNGTRDREFSGQRFWHGNVDGIARATNGLVDVRITRTSGSRTAPTTVFGFVLAGNVTLDGHRVGACDAFTIPAGTPTILADATHDLAVFEAAIQL